MLRRPFLIAAIIIALIGVCAVLTLRFPAPTPANISSISSFKEATAPTLGISPSNTTVRVGDTFEITVRLLPRGMSVNALALDLTYSRRRLELIRKDSSMSPFQLKLAPFVTTSIAAIVQGQPTPGIVTTSILAVFTFKALRPGLATIGINPNAQVLANDGQGTNVLRFVRSARVEVWDKIE